MFFVKTAFVVLCLVSGILAAPLTCDDVTQPAIQTDLSRWYGEWNLVAAGVKVVRSLVLLTDSDSFTLHYNNATFLTIGRYGDQCRLSRYNVTMEGAHFTTSSGLVTANGTIFSSSNCPDCILTRIIMDSSYFTLEHLLLLSRRKEVNPEELQDFKSLVPCLKIPGYVVMDPYKERCPIPEDFYNSH